MKTRIYNAKIFDGLKIISGEIDICDDTICYVGAAREQAENSISAGSKQNASKQSISKQSESNQSVSKQSESNQSISKQSVSSNETECQCEFIEFDKEINADGNLCIPTFKNAHAHSPMTFLRSYADDLPLHDWLFDKVFPNESKLTAEDCYWFTRLSVLEYLSSGMSVVSDMYFHLDAIASACEDSGFRNVILEGITESNKNGLFKKLDEGRASLDGRGGLIDYRLGIHAEYTNDLENMQLVAKYAHEHKMPVYSHISETKKEVEECAARHGMSPIALFDKLGMFENGGVVYHCVHPMEGDLDILARRNVSVITCPSSNAKLASGIAPLVEMLDKGINVAIGTDGAASNNCLDMFREMFFATALQKVSLNKADALDANIVFDMATKNAAKAMGLVSLSGIKVGEKADIAIIDLHQPNMQPLNNIIKNLVYSGSKSNVALTMVGGVVRYDKGNYYVGESVDKIYAECQKRADRILR